MKSIKIVVEEIPPSNNKYLGNSHNFNVYRREKERWGWLIRSALLTGGRVGKLSTPLEKADVKIKYFFKDKRRRDPDNYSGKFILDPLVREGILKDDSFEVVTLNLSAGVDKENPRTEIEVISKEN